MNKYPLDRRGIQNITSDIVRHSDAQDNVIRRLANFLREAMSYVQDEEQEWYEEADRLLQSLHKRKMDFDNLRFDQHNGHKLSDISPYSADPNTDGSIAEMGHESDSSDTLTEEELAEYFGESLPKKNKKAEKSLKKMTLEEIEEWEKKQDDSNNIYKISARVKNLARETGGVLTPVGDSLCNLYTHVLKSLYDFTESIPDKETKIRLMELIKSQEGMPGNLINATHVEVDAKDGK